MISRTQQLAEALADELGRLGFRASRQYLVTVDRDSMDGLELLVVAQGDARTAAARGVSRHEHLVDVGVVAPVADNLDVRELDGLVDVVERVKLLFDADPQARPDLLDVYEHAGKLRHKTLAGLSFVRLLNDPIWNADHLASYSQFTSVIRLTYGGT